MGGIAHAGQPKPFLFYVGAKCKESKKYPVVLCCRGVCPSLGSSGERRDFFKPFFGLLWLLCGAPPWRLGLHRAPPWCGNGLPDTSVRTGRVPGFQNVFLGAAARPMVSRAGWRLLISMGGRAEIVDSEERRALSVLGRLPGVVGGYCKLSLLLRGSRGGTRTRLIAAVHARKMQDIA